MWGRHLIAPHGTEGFRCISCARVANHKRGQVCPSDPCARDELALPGTLAASQAEAQVEQGE